MCVGFDIYKSCVSFAMLGTHLIWYYMCCVLCVQIIKSSVMITVIIIVTSLRWDDGINLKRNDCIRNGRKICFTLMAFVEKRFIVVMCVLCCRSFVDTFSGLSRTKVNVNDTNGLNWTRKIISRFDMPTKYANSSSVCLCKTVQY